MDPTQQRTEDLKKFADEYLLFDTAFRQIPDDKLGFIKNGEECALGGLIVCVTEMLAYYTDVINRISVLQDAKVTEFSSSTDFSDSTKKLMREGILPVDKPRMLEVLKRTQRYFDDRVNQLPPEAYNIEVPIYFDSSKEPTPTTPAMVVKWASEHYIKNTKLIRDEIGLPETVTEA